MAITACGCSALFLFSLILSLSYASKPSKPHAFILPIEKDQKTLQYLTSIHMGTPPVNFQLAIDLRERFLWYICDSSYNSSTYRPVRCGTSKCKLAKGFNCKSCIDHPLKTGCTNNTCNVQPFNSFSVTYFSGDLGEDFLSHVDGSSDTLVRHFLSSCVNLDKTIDHADGLADGTKGVSGLARTPFSLPTQLATKFKLDHKFSLCLPSKNKGSLFVGGGPYDDANSEFLSHTSLIEVPFSTGPEYDDDHSSEYFIDVKSIMVDSKVVNFNTSLLSIDTEQKSGGTKLSTSVPYTTLHTFIYKPLVNDFVNKATARKIKRVEAVAPFEACFDSRTVGKTITGPDVPTIDLVLKGGVKWVIYGANSMVKVAENVICLGFVDGGLYPRDPPVPVPPSIFIGGHQLEDNLLEFDLVSSKLGLSSSLLLHGASCSHPRVF